MLLLENPVRPYAWGRVDGLAPILGTQPSGGPEAELWVGTHPAAPSHVVGDPNGRTLAEVIAADPARWLGPALAEAGHTALPFLLKVLAVGAPLSLQAHPSATEAAAGYAREEASGPARDAPTRTYRDASAKPEALVALGATQALCGFRSAPTAADLIERLDVAEAHPLLERLRTRDEGHDAEVMRSGLEWVLRLDTATGTALAEAVAGVASALAGSSSIDPFGWVQLLARQYPGDPTCLAPLLLEVIELGVGEAIHLPAGNLHAYLSGAGIEIMAASDNVLRGGLTAKHIDVEELLAILHFTPGVPPGPAVRTVQPGVQVYDAGEACFALVMIDAGSSAVEIEPMQPSLLLATDGPVDVAGGDGGIVLDAGLAAFVAPGRGPMHVSGAGRLWWATVGDGLPG